ncbi:MAG: LPS-assembly protein LptD [Candidatus Cloacimonadota bacterium]|nr:MAG: LPS-assembly protein LptD [Candidatus Cloacimonadota bacterium]
MKRVFIIIIILSVFLVLIRAEEEGEITGASTEEGTEETVTVEKDAAAEDTTEETVEDTTAATDERTEKTKKKEIEETSYSAKKIEFLIDEELIILSGSAVTQHKDITVMADTIEYNIKTKIVKAYGHPFLIEENDTITGKLMVYNLETKNGVIIDGATKIEKGFFYGDTIFKVGEKTLNVKSGRFTTCQNIPAHYTFYSKRMKVYGNDMVICEPVVLAVQEIPIFIIPFWFFPIKKGRHSGFLFPKVGKGSSEGRYVRNLTYFWATNDYSDLTFTFDIYEKKGIRTNVEGRYIVDPFLSGNMSGSYINDTSVKTKRWNFYLNHRQTLARRLNLTAHADFMSDVNYNVDYSEEEIVQLNKEIESYVSLSKSWSGANMNFLVNEKRDLAKKTTDRRLPRIGFSLSSRRIIPVKKDTPPRWYNSPYISYSSKFINKIHKDEDTTITHYGLANNFKLQAPQKIFSYFNISPSLKLWENIYDEDADGNRYQVRSYYSTSLSFNTVIYGISKGGISKFEKFRHIIKPSLSYNYSPEEENPEKYYSLEGMGVGSAQKNLSFSLSNLLQTKMKRGGKEKKINLINMKTSVSYNFKKDEEQFSNIRNTFEIEPVKQFSTRVETEHSPYTRELKKFTVRTTLKFQGSLVKRDSYEVETKERKTWRINVTHNFVKGIGENIDSQQLFGGVNTWVTKNWKIGYNTRYDFTEKRLINQSLSIYRDIHCWEAQFSWNSYGGRWKYDFKIKIKKIPEIKVTKGVFGIFIP